MIGAFVRRAHHEEEGVAMIIAVTLSVVIATLAVMSLSVATHADKSTARGRHWVQALHVAESGIEQAIAKVQTAGGAFSGTFSGSTGEGAYSTTVTKGSRNVYTLTATGSVRAGRQLSATRKLQVTLAPPSVFRNALFSYTSIATKNNDTITGDIWANQSVTVSQNAVVHGSIVGATGYVNIGSNGGVDGSVTSGGFDSTNNNAVTVGSNVGGNVTASVVNPPDPITCGGASSANYTVQKGANIGGNVVTWGSVTGSGTVSGTVTQNRCTSAPATIPMPVYTYNASNYDPATLHEFGTPTTPSSTAVTDFQNYVSSHSNHMIGTYYINQSGSINQNVRVDLGGVQITGDTTLVSNTPIFTNGTTDNTTDKVVLMASTYHPPTGTSCDVNHDDSECAIHLKNNFATSAYSAVLIYSPFGPTAIKNNALQNGAVYADSMEIKNNQDLTYDSRVERIVGFGPVTLEITKWLELNP